MLLFKINRFPLIIVLLCSSAILLAAILFEYIGDMRPCELCWYQRYAHISTVVLIVHVLVLRKYSFLSTLLIFGILISLLTGTGLAIFHVGVELQWFTSGCTTSISATTPEELREIILSAPLIPCDEVAWALGGISMAGWNAISSLLLALIILYSILKSR